MQIPAKKISTALLCGLTALFGQITAHAQNSPSAPAPAAPPAAPAQPAAASPTGAPAAPTSDTASSLDYLYNHKPADGSAAKEAADQNQRAETKGIAADAVGNQGDEDPKFKAEFDRYLGMPEVSKADLDAYQAEFKNISDLLDAGKTVDAWKGLSILAQYQTIDAGISKELANRIGAVWMTGKTSLRLDQLSDELKEDIKRSSWNADLMSVKIRENDMDFQSRKVGRTRGRQQPAQPGGQPNTTDGMAPLPDTGQIQGKLQLTEEYVTAMEAKAKIKVNELKQQKIFDDAKKDYATYITTLFASGRFTHVVLAASFYQKVFDEGEYPADMGNQVNQALETARDVSSAVDVFRYKADRKELEGATASLKEAFAKSELNPAVLGLERPLKEKVAEYRENLSKLQNLIESRDFSGVDTLLANLNNSATDFDSSKAKAIVNSVKLDSQLRLGQAKLAAQQGDQKTAMEDFQSAAEAWPGNPDLQDKATIFFNTQDVKTQSTTEFDRLVQEQNYREIFDKQLAFAPAIHGDPKREDQLKDALLKIKDAEVAVEKANTLMMNGDSFGAWETIELESKELPDDKKINKMLADLSGRSAEFVSAINKARDAEGRNELGFSLTWYVNAQRQYPASQIANEAIDRLSKKMLSSKS
jgi:Flp pilus assembly protein TadD